MRDRLASERAMEASWVGRAFWRGLAISLVGLLAAAGAVGAEWAYPSANPQATEEVRRVLDYLHGLRGQGVVTGQHLGDDDDSEELLGELVAELAEGTGRWVGLVETSFYDNADQAVGLGENVSVLIDYWRAGGLVAAHVAMPNLENGGTHRRRDNPVFPSMEEATTRGTRLNAALRKELDALAEGLQRLEDARVPVLFRPYHEMNGGWFWWGSRHLEGAEGYKKLFAYTFEYLTEGKGLDNLIWVWGPSETDVELAYDFYPGARYVDVVGYSNYESEPGREHLADLERVLATGKIFGLTEVGPDPRSKEEPEVRANYNRRAIDFLAEELPEAVFFIRWKGEDRAIAALPEADYLMGHAWARNRGDVRRGLAGSGGSGPVGSDAGQPPRAHAAPVDEAPTHVQADGRLVVEAESGSGGWVIVDEGVSGRSIRATEGENMVYHLRFDEPGLYRVYLLCHHDGDASTNDAFVRLGGARLYGSDRETRPEGMRCHSKDFRWWSLPKGPGAHTPEPIKNDPAHAYVPEPGVYELVIEYRSPRFVIDKIVLQPEEWAEPEGAGPEETALRGVEVGGALLRLDFESDDERAAAAMRINPNQCRGCEHAIQRSRAVARTGDWSMKFTLRPEDEQSIQGNWRSELGFKGSTEAPIEPDGEYWYAWSTLIPEEHLWDGSTEIIGQWHGSPDKDRGETYRNPPLALFMEEGKWKLKAIWDKRELSVDRNYTGVRRWEIGEARGDVWQDWVAQIRWSRGMEGGLLRLWRRTGDGSWERLVDEADQPMGFNDRIGTYFKIGVYKFPWKHGAERRTRAVYFDQVIIGDAGESFESMTAGLPLAGREEDSNH